MRNPTFASYIHTWQARFDPATDPYMTEPGIYYDQSIDEHRYFKKDEIDAINKKEADEYEKLRDHIVPIERTYQGELLYSLPYIDILVYSLEIGYTLQRLSDQLNSKLTFLMDYSIPWLHQKNQFEPVKKAIDYLREINVTEDFVGGNEADGDELGELGTHLFWIFRCNASLPYCFFTSQTDPFVGYVCQYGNLHLHAYSEAIKKSLEQFALSHRFIKMKDCSQNFSGSSAIEGRELFM